MKLQPLLTLDVDTVQTYWQTLYMHDLLKLRLCDIENPVWDDVVRLITIMGKGMYHMMEDGIIVGEVSLDNYTGEALQLHFSMHPGNTREQSLQYGRETCEQLLTWEGVKVLYGLIPIKNFVAIRYGKELGFRRHGILPRGAKFQGKVVDAVLMIRDDHGQQQ